MLLATNAYKGMVYNMSGLPPLKVEQTKNNSI